MPAVGESLLVCDASSNFLTRSMDVSGHALVYAGVQKNVGCAGLTVVIGEIFSLVSVDYYIPLSRLQACNKSYTVPVGKGSS